MIDIRDSELPPCFATWCDNCGHKERHVHCYPYIIGDNTLADESKFQRLKCPKCKRDVHRPLTEASISARFRWIAERFCPRLMNPLHDEVFPCSCKTKPPCRLEGSIEVSETCTGDTCFCRDVGWFRMAGKVKCCGCYAEGRMAMLELHNYRDVEVWSEEKNRWMKAWELSEWR